MELPANHLVGRADEVDSLERALGELDQGQPGAIELAGEPGIGKTRLLRELAARAEAGRFMVLWGSASELEHDLPFSVFLDALDEYLQGIDPGLFAPLDDGVLAELAHVFPSMEAFGRGARVALQQERYRTHRAVRTLLDHLSETKPLVLVLDDMHWGDAASVELLGALLRRPPGGPVLMALGSRPRHLPERLSTALERSRRTGTLTRIELGVLTPAEARQLLGDSVDVTDAAVLYEESGGNPLYLEQLARSLERAGPVSPPSQISPTDLDVPPSVAASLTEELASLSATARSVIEGAAVAGDPFEPELAAAAAGTSEAATIEALDELLRLDLIRETDVPRRFRFRHPLVRRAVYETTRGGWRLGAHGRCAAMLASRGASATVRAHHVERSARQGDLDAVAVLREAGQEAARLAPVSAARWIGAAIRLLPESASNDERVTLLLARAESLAATGRFAGSRADLLDCIALVSPDAEGLRLRVTTACAAVEHLLGLHKEAHRHLEAGLAELGRSGSSEAVGLMIELSLDGFHAVDLEAMRDWAGRAVAAATPLADRALLAVALAVRAFASAFAGDVEQAQMHCDEATELVDELSDDDLARRLDALAHLAGAEMYLDRFADCGHHARRALEIGRVTGQGELVPQVVVMLGGSLWIQGKPREAGEVLEGAVEAARLAGNIQSLAWNLFNRSIAALAAGDLDVALATANESVELEGVMEPGPLSALAAAVLATALLESGQAERSVDLLLSGAGGEEMRLIGGAWRARFLEVLTRALLATGRRGEAERAAAAAKACADAVALPSAAAMADLAAAVLALDADEPAAGAEQALAAVAGLESVGALWDAAQARELAGRALARAGAPDRAALELERAAAAFDSFGSVRYRDQAERELRRLGRRIHRRTRPGSRERSGIESLTERELQVVQLVVDRKTNPQIAGELFLSQKTVETHLRNIFHKMGVTTRADLARTVERVDPMGSGRPR